MFKFNLQLFSEVAVEGIDEDILKELGIEAEADAVDHTDEADAKTETKVDAPPADADSDNKQVEGAAENNPQPTEVATEELQPEEGQPVPYARFKEVYASGKAAKEEVRALKEELAALKAAATPAPQPTAPVQEVKPDTTPVAQPASEAQQITLNQEQYSKVAKIAIERVRKRMNLTEEDVENFEFGDDPAQRAVFQSMVNTEVNNITKEISDYNAKQAAYAREVTEVSSEFNALNAKLNSYPDATERWGYISQTHFVELPQRKQQVLRNAFARIQNGKGTYQDIEMVSSYFEETNTAYEKLKAQPPATKIDVTKKIDNAQRLPKAPAVGGSIGTEQSYTPERIAAALEDPTGALWEAIPAEIRQRVLSGTL